MMGRLRHKKWWTGWVAGWAVVGTLMAADAPQTLHFRIKHSQDPNGMEAWVQGDLFRLERTRTGKKIAEIFDGKALVRQFPDFAYALRLPAAGAAGLMLWKPQTGAGGQPAGVTTEEMIGATRCQVRSVGKTKEWVDVARGVVLKRVSPSGRGDAVVELSLVDDHSPPDAQRWQVREGVKVVDPLMKGRPLPVDLILPRADGGEPLNLGALKGKKALVLNFFATWCQPCVKELPAFATVYQEVQGQDVEIVSIDAGEHGRDPKVLVPPFMKKHNMTWPVVLDEGGWAMDFFLPASSVALPTNIFVSKDGVVREVATGGLSEPQFRGLVKRLADAGIPNPYHDGE